MTQPLPAPRILTQPTTLAPIQPVDPLAQQVGFHIAFVADFLVTGAVLFGREFEIPGALFQDIHNGTPVPVAVGRALQTFAQIELEAGRELVGFAVEYVTFQLNFLANLVTMPVAAIGEFAASLLAGLTPASAMQTVAPGGLEAAPETRQSTPLGPTAVTTPDEVTATGQSSVDTIQRVSDPRTSTSSPTDTVTEQPKKLRSVVVESESVTGPTKIHGEDAVASDQTDVDAAATTTPARSGVTHKRVSDAGSTTSSATRGAGGADAGSQHQPHHEDDGHPKGGGNEGD